MMVRKTLQWIAAILALGGASGGGYAYWLYTQTDEWLRAYAQKAFLQRIPTAVISIGRARFDWSHRIHLYDVKLSAEGLDEPVARCVEIVVTVDGQELSENQTIDVRSLRILHPDVRLIRDAAGSWNWQKLKLARPEDPCPELSFEDLQVGVWLARKGGQPSSFHVQQSAVRLIPSAHRAFTIAAAAQLPGLGDVQCEGTFALDRGTWKVRGGTKGTADITELVESVEHIFPESAHQLADLQNRLQADPVQTADLSQARPIGPPSLSGQAKIDFEIGRDKPNAELDYKAKAVLELNDINHPLLPFPLQNLTGVVYIDKQQLILRNVAVRNGPTQLTANGRIDLPQPSASNRIDIKVQDLMLDQRLAACLPERGRQFFALVHPAGHLDAAGAIVRTPDGKWEMDGWALIFKHCTASHEKFPFPITEIDGTAVQKGNSLLLNFRGWAGERPGTLVGTVRNIGPEAEGDYLIEVKHLPIDHALLTAAKAQPGFHRTLTNLNLRGQVDAQCHFHRPPGRDRKVEWWLDARLNNGSLEFISFPYRLADFSGHFTFDSTQEKWTFEDLQATHGPGRLIGSGQFVKPAPSDPGELKLDIFAEKIPLEAELERACPPSTEKLWALINPTGNLRTLIKLRWIPGTKPDLVIPEAKISDATLEVKSFPFTLDHVTASFMYGREPGTDKDKLSIVSFEGHHDETVIWTDNRSVSFVLCPPAEDPIGEWRLRLDHLHVRDLTPDRTLRRALPAGIRNTVKALDPLGKVDLEGTVELRGTRYESDPITAYWNYLTRLTDATILTGVRLEHVFGRVQSEGRWDGRNVQMTGSVNLDSVHVLNHQFTYVRGPFKLNNQDLIVGSERAFPAPNAGPQKSIPNGERLTAQAVGGTFFLDAKAHLDSQRTTYAVKTAMQNAILDRYARDYGLGSNLHGVMNGWAELTGDSTDPKDVTGRGQLLIHPAALYELPVFIQLFKAFSFAAPDKTAFNYALTTFNIRNRMVSFRDIDLIGDAISLRGKGTARFDGPLNLDFYSRPASAWASVPGLSNLFDQFTQGWVGVSVTGTVQTPRARVIAMPQVDSAMRNFLAAINRPGTIPTLSTPPWMLPAPRSAAVSPDRIQ
jgi:AsmA-like C-terminal region